MAAETTPPQEPQQTPPVITKEDKAALLAWVKAEQALSDLLNNTEVKLNNHRAKQRREAGGIVTQATAESWKEESRLLVESFWARKEGLVTPEITKLIDKQIDAALPELNKQGYGTVVGDARNPLTRAEILEEYSKNYLNFSNSDKNQDGLLSPAEIAAWLPTPTTPAKSGNAKPGPSRSGN